MPSTPKLQCRHIFPDGHRCGSPCLRNEPFCYYHHTTRKPKTRQSYTDTHSLFDLPDLEDRSSIQSAITLVLQRLANGNLDPKRAGLLLYGLQIASSNLPRLMDPSVKPVTEIVEDPTHGTIAMESHIDTRAADALTEIICQRMGLDLHAVAEEPKLKTYNSPSLTTQESKHSPQPTPKSGLNLPESNTLTQKSPTPPQHENPCSDPCASVQIRVRSFLDWRHELPRKPYLFPCAESSHLGVESKQHVRLAAPTRPSGTRNV